MFFFSVSCACSLLLQQRRCGLRPQHLSCPWQCNVCSIVLRNPMLGLMAKGDVGQWRCLLAEDTAVERVCGERYSAAVGQTRVGSTC